MNINTLSQSHLDTVFNLIRRKDAWIKEGKAIQKLEALYKDELKLASDHIHRTRGGEMSLVQNMTDDHLLNTIKSYMSSNHDDLSSVPKRYIDEAKKRDGMLDKILEIETVIEDEYEWL